MGLDAKLKSPKSFDDSGSAMGVGIWGGLEFVDGFEASLGPVSKKPPPVYGGDVTGGAADERWIEGLLKLAKGSDFTCCCGLGACAGGEAGGSKLSPLNALSRPPKLDCC